jgi:uncharacterized protein
MKKRKRKPRPALDHDSIVADWRRHAAARDDGNYMFLHSLKYRDYGFEPDEEAAELHQRAFQIVDCTRCANCCRTMDVILDQADIDRIAGHLGTTPAALIAEHLEPCPEGNAWQMRAKPCAFLGADGRCTIYDVRPAACREFPHTDKPGFTGRKMGHARNALQCPIVYWIIEELRSRAGR